MASDILMVSKDFKGEAKRHGEEYAIEVLSFSFGASRPMGALNQPTATTAYTAITLSALLDAGVVQLMALGAMGKKLEEVAIKQFRAGGDDDVMIWSLTMTKVLVASFNLVSAGGDQLPTVQLALTYTTGTVDYRPQGTSGLAIDPMVWQFDMSAPL